ncbi:alkaline phosphatase family protein [Streptomyces phaeochromogenes]|uniref:Alkaline phosphatase family protein n=1 Tax=Streptomyces phaeochromogenes TaxID=1923 RepID=A0ABZ1HKK6_STRPH|nr:alkaline phosphatase D family protein [Streptomyces phaeochromogenes]MCX5597098.1 alkaline phosphatase family protein [Streptomyces phaeochromogenes]WRZ32613.1 alkaline phosphatase family protein [Streptomyces phaeochromogenes]WSD18071.1 alkaline phosphatase family protein [Streptomyces phaeochromogenes]WSJ05110.1 alkaline phosphatase family protein [Streptomyces phaeochromogenes]
MAGLRLGPLLRYVDGSSATIWVEASRPCTAEVRCPDGTGGESRTFQIAGHHYALIPVTGLTPGTRSPYEVLLDGVQVWPLPDSRFPPSVIHTPVDDHETVRVAFGSCRWATPAADEKDPGGPDALDTLAARIAADPESERPDVLLLLGDQVYADEVSEATRRWLEARRGLNEPPGAEVADYEEYTHLYYESWLDPEIRWLLSTVPSCMIFDDHDVIDDWNTSEAWVADMRATPWWRERILSGLMSYWVHQHLGNLPPERLAEDPLYEAVRATPDGTDALRAFAARADNDPASVRWSYRRDFGRTRLLMVDSRAARVLDEKNRSMLDPAQEAWLREQVLEEPGSYDHLLIGTSLPWLLPNLVHDAEGWNAALCRGERGERWARFGENLRRAADLEHWAAFPSSFDSLAELIAEAGSGPQAPATVCVLSGDVHHAYIAEPVWREGLPGPDARVLQLTCSPVHNSIPLSIRLGFRFGWSGVGRAIGRRFARHGRLERPPVDWRKTGGPWFGNQLMTLTLRGRSARLRLDQARQERGGEARLRTIVESELS